MKRSTELLAMLLCMGISLAHAADPARYSGRALIAVIETFRAEGLAVVYSTDLVQLDMRVVTEPVASEPPDAVLDEILRGFGLGLARRGDNWLVIETARANEAVAPVTAGTAQLARPKLENVVVQASRYSVAEGSPAAVSALDHSDIDQLVGTGREPLRVIGRLPGAATSGLSSKQNIRGGEEDEVLVVFDGVPLFEPFHLKDFQSLFSTLDPRVVGGMEVYTGSFPAQYGDRLSGVIDVMPQRPPEQPHHEIG
ncbi:MAG: TonB-dependent receptor, partial [Gammaproteobacteria bacterium]|nr:TonB-dependent receptor [Gammaproteobacteria bacterium]